MQEKNILYDKSYAFSIRIVKLAQSRADFMNKLMIALKEANETQYWINLLYDTDYISKQMHESLLKDCRELVSLLVSITKSIKNNKGI